MPKPTAPNTLVARVRALQQRLRAAGHDALLIVNPVDTRYLTGFVGDDSWTLVPAKRGQPIVLSDNRFEEQIKQEAPHVTAVMRKKSLVDELAQVTGKRKLQRIAVQCGHLTLAQYDAIGKKLGKRRLHAFEDGLLQQRAVKTDDEVRRFG